MNMDEINSLMSESNGVQPYGADTDAPITISVKIVNKLIR